MRKTFYSFQNNEPGVEGSSGEPGTEETAPAGGGENSRDYEAELQKLGEIVRKERESRKALEQEAKLGKQYRAALGEIDPNRLAEINEALELQSRHDALLAQARSEAVAERDSFYGNQIKELEASQQAILEQHNSLKKRLAIQRYFTQAEVAGRGSELDAFINLTGNQFDYDPIKDEIVKVKDLKGAEMFVNGKPATPADLMLEMRQGKQGFAIASCFVPYNQSNGGGLPVTGADGQPVSDWRAMTKEDRMTLAFTQRQT